MFTKRIPIEERFLAKFTRGATDECWIWSGSINNSGYGNISLPGRRSGLVLAHRLAWTLAFGEIPTGMCVCHKCDVRACVNPSHLFLGTNADNVNDMVRKGRVQRATRPGEACGHAKLTNEQVLKIRADTRRHHEIAKDYDIGRTNVTNIKRRAIWKHLP